MPRPVIVMRVLCLLAAGWMIGCTGSCAPERKPQAVAANAEHDSVAPQAEEARESAEEGEQRELEDEMRERQKALASLASYKADSCEDAIKKMEAALRTGKGHWHERDAQGAIPADLLTRLVEAELWRDQAKTLCADDPHRARFEELRLLMDGIWRYPVTLPREELDKRMAALDQ